MIKENIFKIKERISAASSRAGRDPATVTIVAVSKGRAVSQIKEAVALGMTDIGENRVQEAAMKVSAVPGATWHMVGHLQTNKVKEAVRLFDVIHSVDSVRLAQELDAQAGSISKVQDILLQVNTSGEASKFGFTPQDAAGVIGQITVFKNIRIRGLMTIAPVADDPGKIRPCFRALRQLRDELVSTGIVSGGLPVLSMGMSDDFEVAIEEGATVVRLGRAIFEG